MENQTHGIPALMSMVFPGCGQFVKGNTSKAAGHLALGVLLYLCFVLPGVLWAFYSARDAYLVDETKRAQ